MEKEDLIKVRTSLGFNQQQMAKAIGIDRTLINAMERGKKNVTKSTEILIKNYLREKKSDESDFLSIASEPETEYGKSELSKKTAMFKPIPFFNINVSAGNVTFLDGGLLKNTEPDDYMFIPKNIDADIAFPTFGHSMYPEISNGDRVAYKLLKDWSFFNYGMKYLIVTDEQRLLKYIKKHPDKNHLLLESRNPDYEPIDMPIKSVRYILQVRYIGKTEM